MKYKIDRRPSKHDNNFSKPHHNDASWSNPDENPKWGSGAIWNSNSNQNKAKNFDDYRKDFDFGEQQWDEQSLNFAEDYVSGMDYLDFGQSKYGPSNYNYRGFNGLFGARRSTFTYPTTGRTFTGYRDEPQFDFTVPPPPFKKNQNCDKMPAERPYGSDVSISEKDYNAFRKQDSHQWENRDRKRPLIEEESQTSLAKASKSLTKSSESLTSDFIGSEGPQDKGPISKKKWSDAAFTSFPGSELLMTRRSKVGKSPNEVNVSESDNVLEKAERLCRELKEKRQASQLQQKTAVKSNDQELLSHRMNALISRQRLYMKGHIKDGEKQKESSETFRHQADNEDQEDSGVSSASTIPSLMTLRFENSAAQKSTLSTSSVQKYQAPKTTISSSVKSRDSLDAIRKSIELDVLENRDEVKETTVKPKDKNTVRRRSESGESRERIQTAKTGPIVLSKENLKNLVNAPRSR